MTDDTPPFFIVGIPMTDRAAEAMILFGVIKQQFINAGISWDTLKEISMKSIVDRDYIKKVDEHILQRLEYTSGEMGDSMSLYNSFYGTFYGYLTEFPVSSDKELYILISAVFLSLISIILASGEVWTVPLLKATGFLDELARVLIKSAIDAYDYVVSKP